MESRGLGVIAPNTDSALRAALAIAYAATDITFQSGTTEQVIRIACAELAVVLR